jgi:hypothetical protein
MRYKIYQLVEPEVLDTLGDDMTLQKVNKTVLEDVRDMPYGFQDVHDNMDNAIGEIVKHKLKLKFKDLTIIPIISLNYDGEILE